MRTGIKFFTLLISFFFLLNFYCSDGVDRHKKYSPNTFFLFDEPTKRCGYSVLPKDSEGGADGTLEFRWAQKHLVALVKICAFETEQEFGASKYPLLIFDGCAENGDTPVDWEPTPVGRHPGGSHDGGINLDLGYYLTSIEGIKFTPDYSACSDHFTVAKSGELEDCWICNNEADKLDVERMSFFYLKMFSINRDLFSGELLSQIGADYFVKQAVLKKLQEWAAVKKYGATFDLIEDFKRIVTCDEFEGWAKSHHHHTHIRLNDIEIYGRLRSGIETLFEMENKIDLKLLKNDDNQKNVLRLRLFSAGLERAIEAEILGEMPIKNCLFKIDEGEWIKIQKGEERNRTFFELPSEINAKRKSITITAQFVDSQEKLRTISKEITLPIKDARLYVSFDPNQVRINASKQKDKLFVKIDYPQIYEILITDIFYEVQTEKGVEKIEFAGTAKDASIPLNNNQKFLLSACFKLCSRKTVKIPIYIGGV